MTAFSLDRIEDLFHTYIIDSHAYGGLIMIGCGLLILIGAFRDWDWIFGDVSTATYRLDKLDGIINVFGRKAGRIAAGAVRHLWLCSASCGPCCVCLR